MWQPPRDTGLFTVQVKGNAQMPASEIPTDLGRTQLTTLVHQARPVASSVGKYGFQDFVTCSCYASIITVIARHVSSSCYG